MDDSWFQIKNIDEIPSPTVLVYPDRIAANLQAMIESVDDPRRLRPHVKTHKMSQIVRMKLDAGITKFKTATIAETEMVLDAGGRDVLLAMQCVGPNLGRLITLMRRFPDATITSLVDHQSTLNHFHKIAIANKVRLRLMIDLNVGMDRTGIAPGDDALELLRTMCALPGIIPAGLHAYDGHLRDADDETLEHQVEAAFEPVWRLRDRCRQAGMTIDRVVASGTPTSHLLARYDDVEVSAGTTVLWDAGQLQVTPSLPYQVAAVVLTRVISRPARDLICIDLGHKAIASEFKPPRVQLFGLDAATFVSHSEEHMVLRTELADRNPPGTVLYGLPFHICPTMALHASVWCVRNQIAAESWRVAARDRCLTV